MERGLSNDPFLRDLLPLVTEFQSPIHAIKNNGPINVFAETQKTIRCGSLCSSLPSYLMMAIDSIIMRSHLWHLLNEWRHSVVHVIVQLINGPPIALRTHIDRKMRWRHRYNETWSSPHRERCLKGSNQTLDLLSIIEWPPRHDGGTTWCSLHYEALFITYGLRYHPLKRPSPRIFNNEPVVIQCFVIPL